MIDRRMLIGALAGSLVAQAFAADALPTEKVWRIGYLGVTLPGASPESDRIHAAFIQGLREGGFIEGKNIVLERRAIGGHTDRAAAAVAELIRLRVDVLVTIRGSHVKQAAATIPIVVTNASDPVASGLVASLAHLGGNVTGLTTMQEDLYPKRLEILKAAAPGAVRVAFVDEGLTRADVANNLDAVARALGVKLLPISMKTPEEFERTTAIIVRERAGALLIGDNAITYALRRELADFAIRQRLPTIAGQRAAGAGGALMSYGPDLAENYRKAAGYVVSILNGAKPADLPMERPTKVELIINLKTAKAIGLTIPQSLLLRADEVIQ
jgi:putative tryptophan/tyrosine transport system substrate-binding protein